MRKKGFKFKDLIIVLSLLTVISVGLWLERRGISYDTTQNTSYYLSDRKTKTPAEAMANTKPTTLIIYNSQNETSASAIDNFRQIFVDMKVSSTYVDLAAESIPDYNNYTEVIIATPDLEPMGQKALDLMDWVEAGGNVMFATTLQKDNTVSIIEQSLGIAASSYQYAPVNEIYIKEGFMLGHSQSYTIDEAFESAWKVELDEAAQVHMTTNDKDKVPLVWSYDHGQGRVVISNFGIYVKAMRGFYAAAYSLLDEVGAYPVINSAAFTIDDFPAPVPSGDAKYIARDYNMSVSDFYSNVWWPDMMRLAEQHKIKYTGVLIETYEDKTDGNISQQTDTSRFTYFGNMLLKIGGEIGYHGYNHQPLNVSSIDYGDIYQYNKWKGDRAMENAMDEVTRFVHQVFPEGDHSVYVPPSNVISDEGRELLVEKYPEIKAISSVYFGSDLAYSQEFQVSDDGMIDIPRLTYGFIIDDFNKLTAVSELNMHYVSHHFVHPDDAMDVDRGAKLGWAKMFKNLDRQMDWVYKTVPNIRNQTESQLAGSVQRFSSINVSKTVTDKEVKLNLGNFADEAYLMVRFNEGKVGHVSGGKLEKLTGDLYLLHATDKTVTIQRQ